MFVLKGQEDSIQFLKKLKNRRIAEILRGIIINLDYTKIKNPMTFPITEYTDILKYKNVV